MAILIENAQILTMVENKPVFPGNIVIDKDIISYIGTSRPGGDYTIVHGDNCLAMPGLINAHTHAAMSLLRGYADDLPLMEWLESAVWPIEAKFTPNDIYWGTMLTCLEMLKNGITTFADMYFFMGSAAQAVVDSGLRAVLSKGMSAEPNSIEEGIEFAVEWRQKHERITTMLGPHAPYTCPPKHLAKVIDAAEKYNLPIHMHLAETAVEVANVVKSYGMPVVKLMEKEGLFRHHVLGAHLVHVDQEEIVILAENKVHVAHNPVSNMKLASGTAPILSMKNAGINIALGCDGPCSNNRQDMFAEMKTASLLQKVVSSDSTALKAPEVLAMATVNGAKALNLPQTGELAIGKQADIILIKLDSPNLTPRHNLISHLVYAAAAGDVQTVIVAGQILMENRRVLAMDEEKIMAEANTCILKHTS